ncbi:hypothetical protein GXW83_17715 [Streptacidiphilus sp. PB12-B1b]|uniref:DUF6400 family protein n=1 Tax=Streptacidiphilus sp. PB12-B1b TaxID=2705012 RepID=UPI0015FE2E28|nr:DUF6400 family protein [Streptacidiphilus sp. PB12-B1b]QMU77265.1 hypothetical protein GXW83_17715 [Streptacidiphilus sp. PB12-B1b]
MPSNPADPTAHLVAFDVDLTLDEVRRRAEVLAALGPHWDPVQALRSEEEAYALLYSGLDTEQQALYDTLVTAGILPGQGRGHAAP